jgi:putative phage-type endonuclease
MYFLQQMSDSDSISSFSDYSDESDIESSPLLSDDLRIEVETAAVDLIEEYMEIDVLSMSSPSFNENLIKDVSTLLFEQVRNLFVEESNLQEEITEIVKEISDIYFINLVDIPPRSYDTSIILTPPCVEEITSKINYIRNMYQPAQKTPEWYEFRHGLFTASNIWKIFNKTQQNNIIYEKCRPYTPFNPTNRVNVNNSLHWGVKYEPVSVMLYENKYNTKIEDFGCIRHPIHYFIGASPDGINVDPTNERYGRMIEIKNVVNRDITPFPKEEYWIQMQIQMETCDLDECDFIETRFKEISEETFHSNEYEQKGIILYFIENSEGRNIDDEFSSLSPSPTYKYMPLNTPTQGINDWISTTTNQMQPTHKLYDIIYWGVDEFSCILVTRNKKWFEKALPLIESTWRTIEKEKIEGFEHRCPKKPKINVNLENIIREYDITQFRDYSERSAEEEQYSGERPKEFVGILNSHKIIVNKLENGRTFEER